MSNDSFKRTISVCRTMMLLSRLHMRWCQTQITLMQNDHLLLKDFALAHITLYEVLKISFWLSTRISWSSSRLPSGAIQIENQTFFAERLPENCRGMCTWSGQITHVPIPLYSDEAKFWLQSFLLGYWFTAISNQYNRRLGRYTPKNSFFATFRLL